MARGLMMAWPDAQFGVVQVGAVPNVPGAMIHRTPEKFEHDARAAPISAVLKLRRAWQARCPRLAEGERREDFSSIRWERPSEQQTAPVSRSSRRCGSAEQVLSWRDPGGVTSGLPD